jgi:glycosyltransferase involved in cell wall biosynthesis
VSTPLVSIVIPAYNNERYIAETLRSVLAQDYENLEVVIADHSSIDDTATIIASFDHDPRLRILTPTPQGGGALANWNRVSEAARGTYLKLVCGDDLLDPSAVSLQVQALTESPSAVIVSSQRRLIDANGDVFLTKRGLQGVEGLVRGKDAVVATVRAGTNIFGEPACSLLRRDILEKVGWWDNTHPYLIDEATLVNICGQGDLVALKVVLASFRVSGGQWSVRLAASQAGQVKAFHDKLFAEGRYPLTRQHLVLGGVRASLTAYARKLAYIRLKKRMGHESVVESTT